MMKPINWFYTSEKDVNLLKPVLYQISNKHAEFLTTQKGYLNSVSCLVYPSHQDRFLLCSLQMQIALVCPIPNMETFYYRVSKRDREYN